MLRAGAMQGLRTAITAHRTLFALLAILALAARLVLPQGMMLSAAPSGLTVMICAESGTGPAAISIPMKADPGKDAAESKAKEACPYSALGMGGLAAADPFLIAAALTFILLLGFGPQTQLPARVLPRALPPLRGPPAHT